jgi:hypothetical protein
MRSRVDLPQPGRPDDDDELAVGNVDRHAVNHLVGDIALANVAKLDFSHFSPSSFPLVLVTEREPSVVA